MELTETIQMAEIIADMGLTQTQTSIGIGWIDAIRYALIYTFLIAVFLYPLTYFLPPLRPSEDIFTWFMITTGILIFIFFTILIGFRTPATSSRPPPQLRGGRGGIFTSIIERPEHIMPTLLFCVTLTYVVFCIGRYKRKNRE